MKRICFVLLLVLLLSAGASKCSLANHVPGGYLTYKVLPNDSLEIILGLFRDCNGIPINPNPQVVVKQGNDSVYVSLTRIAINDITGVCGSYSSLCASGSLMYNQGYQENLCVKRISIAQFSASQPIKIYFRSCCIAGSTTNVVQGEFYLEAICFKSYIQNEGPIFKRPLTTVFLIGASNAYNADILNAYSDSMVYEMMPVMYYSQTSAIPQTYFAPYTFDKPFQYSGSSVLPLNFDQTTRQLRVGNLPMIIPTSVQKPMIAYKVSRYRNGVFIGSGNVAHVISMAANNSTNIAPTVSSNSDSYKVCAGSSLCFNVFSSDANIGDSTRVMMDTTSISGVSFVSNNQKNATGTFCWTPTVSHVRVLPYYFTFRVVDNSCPKTLESFITIAIRVDSLGGTIQATPTVSYNYCIGKVDFDVQVSSGPGNYTYNWRGSKNVSSDTARFSHLYTGLGWHSYSLRITSPGACGDYLKNDSVFIPSHVPFASGIFNRTDTVACKGLPLMLQPSVKGGRQPFSYFWNNSTQHTATFTFTGIHPDTVYLRAVDSFGCVSNSSIRIAIRDNPNVTILGGDKTICISPIGVTLSANQSGGVWSGTSCVNNLQKIFVPQLSCVGQNEVVYTLIDNYGCVGRDTVIYTVTDKLKSDAGTYTSVCATTGFVQLYGSPAGGTWFGDSVRLNKFYPSQFKVGLNQLIYRSPLSCSVDDTTYLEVLSAPPVSILVPDSFCSNVSQATLNALPAGGSWFGNHIINDKFNVQAAGAGKHEIAYYYYSPAGCLTSNSKWITIQSAPAVSAGADLTVCKNSGAVNLSATPSGGQWSGQWISLGKFNSDSAIGGTYTNVYQFSSGICNLRDTMKIHLLEAGFDAAVVSGNAPLTVNFNNTSSSGFDYYSWIFGDPSSGSNNISNATNPSHTYYQQGVYSVKLTAGNIAAACQHSVTRTAYIAIGPNGIYSPTQSAELMIFPNPANQTTVTVLFNQSGRQGHYTLEVLNMTGARVQLHQFQYNAAEQLSLPAQGIYFVRATMEDGTAQVKKLQVLR